MIGLSVPRSLPPLSLLRAFEATARHSSVSRAAEELGRTHGAVSKALKALGDDFGAPLFDRVGTGLRPNAAGRRLAALVGTALHDLAHGYEELRRETASPSLHVACSASFAMGWLVPHLPRFSQAHPEVGVRLTMTSARGMREEREADLVVLWDRSNHPPDDRTRAIPLGPARFGLVAAPGYPVALGADGTVRAPRRILHDHTNRAWDEWQARTGRRIEAPATLSFPHTHLCLGAASAGMGVAISEQRLATAELAAGRLVAVAEPAEVPDGFAVIPHRAKPLSPVARRFVEWLQREMAPAPGDVSPPCACR